VIRLLVVVMLGACGGPGAPRPIESPRPKQPVAADATTWDKLEGPIKKVEIEAKNAKLRGDIERVFAAELGQPLDRVRLRGRLDATMKLAGVAELAVRGTQIAGGIELTIEVTAQPKLHAITARDSAGKPIALTGSDVPAVGTLLDPRLVGRLAGALRDRYRDQGFVSADASWGTRPAGSDAVDVLIEVATGEQLLVGKLEVKGNTLPTGELLKVLSAILVVGEPVAPDRVERASVALTELYYDRGYPNVQIANPTFSGAGRTTIGYTIVEGDRFKLGAITIKGVEPKLAKGATFSRIAIKDAAQRLRDAARQDGMANAEVLPLTKVDLKAKTIAITFEISHSP